MFGQNRPLGFSARVGEQAACFAADYDRIRGLVRQKLWNEEDDGMYENRFWDWTFFEKHFSPTQLLSDAGRKSLPPEQAKRMVPGTSAKSHASSGDNM